MKQVSYALFHQVLFVPGVGQLGNALPSNSKTVKDLAMFESETGLLISGVSPNNSQKFQLLVPWANVVVCQFAKA